MDQATDFRLPELGEGVYEAELVAWKVRPGDVVKRGQPLVEVMTDKATMEVPSPFAGTVASLRAEPGQTVKVGDVVLTYAGGAGAEREEGNGRAAAEKSAARPARARTAAGRMAADPATARPETRRPGPASRLPAKAAPSVRLLARKLGIDLEGRRGSGPGGRILVEDLAAAVPREGPARPAAEPKPDYGTPGTRLPLHGLRRKIAEHMVRAKQAAPHATYVDECDVTDLVRLRESLRERFARAGVKLTYLAFIVKAVAAALKDVPIVNASLDEEAGEIVLHDRYDIGIAVATTAGLVVPVVRVADRKDLPEVAREVERLSALARAGKARPEDLRGGTFTVTSVGNLGGLFSTPIINHPEVAILGVGRVVRRPVFDAAGNVRPADLVYLSLSFDHRVVDGAVGAAFTNAVMRRLREPAALLLPECFG